MQSESVRSTGQCVCNPRVCAAQNSAYAIWGCEKHRTVRMQSEGVRSTEQCVFNLRVWAAQDSANAIRECEWAFALENIEAGAITLEVGIWILFVSSTFRIVNVFKNVLLVARKNQVCIALIDRLPEQVWTNVCEIVLLECENVLLECENALLERSRYASPWLTAWLSKCKQRLPLVSDRIQDAMLTVMKTPCMTIEELHRFLTNLQDVGMSLQASTQTLVCKDLVRRWFSLVCRVSV